MFPPHVEHIPKLAKNTLHSPQGENRTLNLSPGPPITWDGAYGRDPTSATAHQPITHDQACTSLNSGASWEQIGNGHGQLTTRPERHLAEAAIETNIPGGRIEPIGERFFERGARLEGHIRQDRL
jgi:hypothetical protein